MDKTSSKKTKTIKLAIFTAAVLGLGIFMLAGEARAATYYANPSGSGTTCSSGSPCSLTYAVETRAANGDTVIAQAGTYNDSITISKSITLQGTLDGSGNRLSIIDPYVNVSGGWTHDGYGVYKKNIGWKSWGYLVEIGGSRYKIWRFCQPGEEHSQYNCNSWKSHMQKPNTSTYTFTANSQTYGPINWWHGIEAAGTGVSDGYMWLSFADDSDVSAKTIYAATSGTFTIDVTADNVTIKDFDIRAKRYGIYSASSSNITIDNNKIIYGNDKIYLVSGGGHTITDNYLEDYSYAESYVAVNDPSKADYQRGAWSSIYSQRTTVSDTKYHLYQAAKYEFTADANGDDSRGIFLSGDNITITGNEIGHVTTGINARMSSNLELANNYIHHSTGSAFLIITLDGGGANTAIHDNIFVDVNAGIRFAIWDGDALDGNQVDGAGYNTADVKIYNNRFWLPTQPTRMGTHIKFWYNYLPTGVNSGTIYQKGKAWIYHNSFSGGLDAINVGGYHAYYKSQGLENVYFVNNILSSTYIYNAWSSKCNCTPSLGGVWYNWQGGSNQYSGTGNINNGTTLMWDTTALHDFNVTDSRAINAGIDISQPFTISGKTYPDLPGFTAGYGGTDGPDMGWINTGGTPPPSPAIPADVDGSGSVNIKDIQAVIRVIVGTETDPIIVQRADVSGDGSVNIRDIQEIIRAIIGQ